MANQEHLAILKQGVEKWNQWRKEHSEIQPEFVQAELSETDLSGADLNGAILNKANLSKTNLSEADLSGADLSNATLWKADLSWAELRGTHFLWANLNGANLRGAYVSEAVLYRAYLNEANLSKTHLRKADLSGADLIEANLYRANLSEANLNKANLSGADLREANLRRADLSEADLSGANLTGCFIYAISAWNVRLEETIQSGLIITPDDEPTITVDNLNVAQFIYLLLNNAKIRDVIDSITSKVVLILGRFTEERKNILDALRDELRKHNFSPVLFDFEKPSSRDFTETVRTLAHLSRFIIADLTDPSSIPQELQALVPDLEIPVQPLLLEAKREYSMFVDFRKYHWVLPVYLYKDRESLIASLQDGIIEPADKKARELTVEKAKRLETR